MKRQIILKMKWPVNDAISSWIDTLWDQFSRPWHCLHFKSDCNVYMNVFFSYNSLKGQHWFTVILCCRVIRRRLWRQKLLAVSVQPEVHVNGEGRDFSALQEPSGWGCVTAWRGAEGRLHHPGASPRKIGPLPQLRWAALSWPLSPLKINFLFPPEFSLTVTIERCCSSVVVVVCKSHLGSTQ